MANIVYPDTRIQTDWRIGLTVKPKYQTHLLYGQMVTGKVVASFESGTAGIHDKNGVLAIRLNEKIVALEPADWWVTA